MADQNDNDQKKKQITIVAKAVNEEEIKKLREELEKIRDEHEKAVKEIEELRKEKELTEEEKLDLEAKLAEIAEREFQKEKELLIEELKKAELEEEKINFISEKLETPEDLERTKYIVQQILSALPQEPQKPKEGDQDKDKNKDKTGQGTDQNKDKDKKGNKDKDQDQNVQKIKIKAPSGKVSMPPKQKVYNTAKEMIDDLYDRAEKGDKEAEIILNKIWEKWWYSEKKELSRISIARCPQCGAGIPTSTRECPFCGYKIKSGVE